MKITLIILQCTRFAVTMAKTAAKFDSEDLVAMFSDQKVIEACTKLLLPVLSLAFETRLAGLSKSLESVKNENIQLKKDHESLAKECETLKEENDRIIKMVRANRDHLDAIDRYTRRENLIFRGLPTSSYAESVTASSRSHNDDLTEGESDVSVENTVLRFCREALEVNLKPTDIAIAHRLKKGRNDTHNPVIARFANNKVKNLVFNARKKLKASSFGQVFISEQLTPHASEVFFEARHMLKEKKITAVWTRNGEVLVRYVSDQTTRGIIVRSKEDLIRSNHGSYQ